MVISLQNLRKSYGQNEVLKDISFELKGGDVVGVIGRNGAGKSTLLNCLAGIIPLDSAHVKWDNVPVQIDSNQWKSKVGFVSDKVPLIDDFTAIEYLLLSGTIYGLSRDSIIKRGQDLYHHFFEEPIEENRNAIKSYSTGMRRKLQVITSLLHKPDLLILDEPFSGLDDPTDKKLVALMKKYVSMKTIIVFTSHNIQHHKILPNKWLIIDNPFAVLSTFDDAESSYHRTATVSQVDLNVDWL